MMVEWIKVEDALPELRKMYICWTKADYGDGIGIGFYDKETGKWIIADQENDNVVAWSDFNYFEG